MRIGSADNRLVRLSEIGRLLRKQPESLRASIGLALISHGATAEIIVTFCPGEFGLKETCFKPRSCTRCWILALDGEVNDGFPSYDKKVGW
jgi:hypothetical protein